MCVLLFFFSLRLSIPYEISHISYLLHWLSLGMVFIVLGFISYEVSRSCLHMALCGLGGRQKSSEGRFLAKGHVVGYTAASNI